MDYKKLLNDDLKFLLSTQHGRRYLHELLDYCGLYRTSMAGSSETFFREGMRSTGLKILADITEADPEAYLKMMSETKNLKEQIKVFKEKTRKESTDE